MRITKLNVEKKDNQLDKTENIRYLKNVSLSARLNPICKGFNKPIEYK